MSQTNKFGLTRNSFGRKVKAIVRRRCGFGCVLCGDSIYTYEHFDPPFSEAHQHDPQGITLLCGSHQNESQKKLLSKETIPQANFNPACKKQGYVNHVFDLQGRRPFIQIGSNTFFNFQNVLKVKGECWFQINAPEIKSRLWTISATFKDRSNNIVADIVRNELRVHTGVFDFEQKGPRFIIRDVTAGIVLDLTIYPPDTLVIKKLRMVDSFYSIEIDQQSLSLKGLNGSFGSCNFSNTVITECKTCIRIDGEDLVMDDNS